MTVQTDTQNYRIRRKGGRSLFQHPPLFSPDGQSLLVICENTVRVYNVKTGECVRVLEPEADSDEEGTLISIRFLLEEPHNLYGCLTLGRVIVWSWEAGGAVLREKKLNLWHDSEKKKLPLPNAFRILTFDMLEPNVCLVSVIFKNIKKPYLMKICLKAERVISYYKLPMSESKIWQVAVGWTSNGRFAAICDGTAKVHFCDLSKPKQTCESYTNLNEIRVISIAAHPTESCIVVGDALGRAVVWKGNLTGNNKTWAKEIFHWHTLPVFTAAFSVQGGFMVTGGLERVLVKWQLGSLAAVAKQRETLPRLPGAIRHVAVSVPHIAIVVDTNAIVITTPQLRLVSTIIESGGLAYSRGASTSGIVYHRGLDACLVGGRTGRLQLISTVSDDVLYNIDITGVNLIAPTRYCPNPVNLQVTCTAVSADGHWLVTSEYRCDGKSYPEEYLKFWIFRNKSDDPLELNTCVSFSHGGCKLTQIVINNSSDYAVTAGTDQKFRIWKKEFNQVNKVRKIYWSCVTACYYAPGVGASLDTGGYKNFNVEKPLDPMDMPYMKEFKDDFITDFLGLSSSVDNSNDMGSIRMMEAVESNMELGGVAISQDGSLIAAWFGSRLTLWDSHTCELRSVLSHPLLKSKGRDVVFGNDDASHYLVCSTDSYVCAWSLLSVSVRWLVPARGATLAADPASNLIAAITENNDVFVLTPHSAKPILSRRRVVKPESGALDRCVFAPSTRDTFKLYFMRNDSEIYVLEREDAQQTQLEVISRASLPLSNFGALVAEQRTTEVRKKQAADLDRSIVSDPHVNMFAAASHMLPPPTLLCTSFLQQLCGVSTLEDPERPEERPEDSHSESEAEAPSQREYWKVDYAGVRKKRLRKILEKNLEEAVVESLLC